MLWHAPGCCHVLDHREDKCRGRNVFMEEAVFVLQRAMLSDFKHGIKIPDDESAKKMLPLK